MKKILSLALTIALLIAFAAPALATPFYLESLGVTIEVPDGMTAADATTEDQYALGISVDGRDDIGYIYVLQYVEAYEGRYIEDLSDEEGEQLVAAILSELPNAQFGAIETDGYKLLLVASEDATQLHYLAILNGWLCDVAVVKQGEALNDEEIAIAAQLLLSIQFDADEAAEEEVEEE